MTTFHHKSELKMAGVCVLYCICTQISKIAKTEGPNFVRRLVLASHSLWKYSPKRTMPCTIGCTRFSVWMYGMFTRDGRVHSSSVLQFQCSKCFLKRCDFRLIFYHKLFFSHYPIGDPSEPHWNRRLKRPLVSLALWSGHDCCSRIFRNPDVEVHYTHKDISDFFTDVECRHQKLVNEWTIFFASYLNFHKRPLCRQQ